MMKPHAPALGIISVLFASVLWGTTGTAATFAPNVSPLAIGAAAMGGGGLLQALMAMKQISANKSKIANNLSLFLIGAMAITVYPLAFYTSMNMAGVAVGNVVSIGLAPLAAAVFEWVFEKKRLSRRWKIGATVGISGAILLCVAKAEGHTSTIDNQLDHDIIGIGFGIIAACSYALYSWVARQMILRGVASRAAMGSIFGAASILLLPSLFWVGEPFLESVNAATVGLYMAVVPMFIGYVCFGYGLAHIPVSTITVLTLFEPVVAALLAVVVVGEALPLMAWSGIVMIVGCLAILTIPLPQKWRIT